ncbi:hypothetical protein [Streptomyces curacoi]|nr:hypothetical protein [Streptomyces curacoi]
MPHTDLRILRLEGLSPADAAEEDDRYLGCDLSEYYGGDTFATANRLVLTQLKYSVKHSGRAWTAARLCQAKTPGGAPPLRRLADMFSGLAEDWDASTVVSKINVALVSNQPADVDLLNALKSAQAALADRPLGAHAGRAFASLAKPHQQILTKLRSASGLKSGRFTDFVRVLDLSGCGADSRALQTLTLHQEASSFLVGSSRPGVIGLIELMRQQMLPETAGDPGLSRADIIVALGASGERSLFPYPTLVAKPKKLVPTAQPQSLAAAVTGATAGKLLAHGGPGVGKTTVLTALEAELPPGSILVAYDCYGDGQYLNPANDRHSERAVVQIANDVAVRGGALPLVVPDGPVVHSELWRGLERTLTVVADALPESALLVVAVDAADNAVFAAHRSGAEPFVRGLWHMQLPPNVRVLMTARSARRSDVLAGAEETGITETALGAFDASASAAMLRSMYPNATDNQCAAFHAASNGVARVQTYALGAGEQRSQGTSETPAMLDIEDVLVRAEAGLAAIFDEVLDSAFSTVHDRDVRQQHMGVLAAMARPARPSTLARVLKTNEGRVRQLCDDLFPALRISDGAVGFADEDFENHLRQKLSVSDVRQAHDLFAEDFLHHRHVDEEAARLVGEHLFNSGRHEELLAIALDEGAPAAIADGIARAQAQRTRLTLALRAVMERNDNNASGDAVRLLLAAGDAARTDSSLVDTVRQRPELALLHADASTVAEILLREESGTWRGRAHFRAAAMLAWLNGRTAEAVEQLDLAYAWLRAWSRQDAGWELSAEDIAYGVHAAYVLRGLNRAHRLAAGWNPPQFVDKVTWHVAQHAPAHVPVKQAIRDLNQVRASAWTQAQFAVAYARAGESLPGRWVLQVATRLDRLPLRPVSHPAEWGMPFCEIALAHGAAKSKVRRLLRRFAPPVPSHLNSYTGSSEMLSPLKAACLEAAIRGSKITAEKLLPDNLRPPTDNDRSYDKNESTRRLFLQIANDLLPVVTTQAECVKVAADRKSRADDVELATAEVVQVVRSRVEAQGSEHRFDRPGNRQRVWFMAAVEALVSAARAMAAFTSIEANAMQMQIENLLADVGKSIGQQLADGSAYAWVQMSRILLENGVAREVALQLLQRVGDVMGAATVPATERRDVLLDAAAAAQHADTALAADLFAAAVDAASGVDVDVALRLRALLTIADRIPDRPTDPTTGGDRAHIARRLAHAVEDATPFVPDPREQVPYRLALSVASRLHGPSGLALACRWEDDGHVGLSEGIGTVIPLLAETGTVGGFEAFWMLRLLSQHSDVVTPAVTVLRCLLNQGPAGRSQAVTCLGTLADWVVRDLPPHQQGDASRNLNTAIQEMGLGQIQAAQRLQSRAQELSALSANKPAIRSSRDWGGSGEEQAVDIAGLVSAASFIRADQDLPVLVAHYASDERVVTYLTTAAHRAGPSGRTTALEELLKLADRGVRGARAPQVARVVSGLCYEWRASASVRDWASQHLPMWVSRHLLDLFTTGLDRHGNYGLLLKLPSNEPGWSNWLLPSASAHLDELTANQLYTLAASLAETLPATSTLSQIIEWALDSRPSLPNSAPITRIPAASAISNSAADIKAARETLPEPPEDSSTLFAAVLWALLGHPDRRVRWRAAHTARIILTRSSDGSSVADALWRCVTEFSTGGSFRSATLEFFPLSAQQWLLIVFARVASEAPLVLVPLATELAAMAVDRSQPHAAIRELARQAALDVAAAHPEALPAHVVSDLAFANRPRLCSTSRDVRNVGSRYGDYDTRFHFDSMDVVPYWYSPLAEAFDGVFLADVMQSADKWISERWGRSSEETRQDPRAAQHERSWALISADHGSLPIVETLQKYLEYHALHMVAGELIDGENPVLRHWRDDDEWTGWLTGHLPHSSTHWLADIREPVPARSLTLGMWDRLQLDDAITSVQTTTSQDASTSAVDPDSAVRRGFDGAAVARQACRELDMLDDDPEMIVVSASITTYSDRHSCTAWLTSALVTPEASAALLAALASSTRPQGLPGAGEGPPWGDEIDEPKLQLLGWIVYRESDDGGLDRDDPLTGGITTAQRSLFTDFFAWAHLSANAAGTQFIDPKGKIAAHMTCWGDENKRGQRNTYDDYSGSYLSVRRDVLMAYLKERCLSLALAADAHVYLMNRSQQEAKDEHRRARYTVLHEDGRRVSVEVDQTI